MLAITLRLVCEGKGTGSPAALAVSRIMNECWSADFMSDAHGAIVAVARSNEVDDFNREALAIEVV